MFVEHNRTHVWLINNHVHDHKAGIGEFRCNSVECSRIRKAGYNNGVVASLCKTAQCLFALGVGLQFEFAIFNTGFISKTLCAGIGGFVEGFVELAAQIVYDRWVGLCGGNGCSAQKCGSTKHDFCEFHSSLPC